MFRQTFALFLLFFYACYANNLAELPSKTILFVTMGTRGDVQPFIALCLQLQRMTKSKCRIATHSNYKEWIESSGIEFRTIPGDAVENMKMAVKHKMVSLSFAVAAVTGCKWKKDVYKDVLAASEVPEELFLAAKI